MLARKVPKKTLRIVDAMSKNPSQSHSWGSDGLFYPMADWLCNIGFVLLAMLLSIEQNRQKTEETTGGSCEKTG